MSTAIYSSGKPPASTNRWLWAAVGALGVTTAALGVALVQMRNPPSAPSLAGPAAVPVAMTAPPPPAPLASTPTLAPQAIALPSADTTQKRPVALTKPTHAASKKIATMAPAGSPPPEPVPMQPSPMQPPPPLPSRVVCATCATVVAVTPVQHDGQGSGAGVAAGAVLGGLLGNQVGGGDGKTIATVLGAVGGGWAGNTVEKRMKKVTAYQIDLRMDDGSTQRLEYGSPLSVGTQVTVNGGRISP